ncbi:pyroglutamyl-peptidase I family protein [Glutamicibacter arilaitensis]|uniref:Pyroglutamyl-peptidase I n=1 Tax=Glutamicibacter arilaitensis TaxID=256701 RepID=A0A4Y8TVK2_9MICC|nr:pyroglutamyl-peptidase I [Glutamicibacter arilaitensis]TFH55599.1 pyroglutamyl-peptidase I [Glutamicibacter arilaitensis]
MHILVTGFEPFGKDSFNASQEAVSQLPGQISNHRITTAILPVSFKRSAQELDHLLAEHRPDAVICVGEAGGRDAITPEARGANLDDARIQDNDGDQPRAAAIDPRGPDFLEASLNPAAAVKMMLNEGFKAELSTDAGRFVCNHVAYLAYRQPVPSLFIHVPALRPHGVEATVGAETDPGARKRSTLEVGQLPRALEAAIRGACSNQHETGSENNGDEHQ